MIICINCQTPQLEGSIFCSECGASIMAMDAAQTAPQARIVDVPRPPCANEAPAAAAAPPGSPSLTLVVSSSGRQFVVHAAEQPVLVGRHDEARGICPGVDLSAAGGYEAGVSRKHAALMLHEGRYYVEDLGSANGTFVNGRQIAPQTPMSLAHGDELRCGMLRLRVEIT